MRKKGISPLIASVLLLAFTMSVAVLFSPFATDLLQGIQSKTSQDAVKVQQASELSLKLVGTSFNRSSDELEIVVQNTGEEIGNRTNISASVVGDGVAKELQYDTELASQEVKTLKIPLKHTYPLETITVSMTNYPVSTESGIKCTPTKGLVGYWTFNEEHTGSGSLNGISGYNLSLQKNGGVKLDSGKVGESYYFDGSDDYLYGSSSDSPFALTKSNSTITLTAWVKPVNTSDLKIVMGRRGPHEKELLVDKSGVIKSGFATNSGAIRPESSSAYSGNWVFLAANLYNDSSGDPSGDIYVNGDFVATAERADATSWKFPDDFYIGDNAGGAYFKGNIDEARFYNRSLSKSGIQRLYQVRSESWAVDGCKLTG